MTAVMPKPLDRELIVTAKQEPRGWRVSPLLLVLVLLGVGVVALVVRNRAREAALRESARYLSERAGQLIVAASMELADVVMEAGRVFQPPDSNPNWLPGDHRVVFRVPAAAVSMLDLDEGRMGGQRIGFSLWSETLDPVRPDELTDRAACRADGPASPCPGSGIRPADGGRVGARLRGGEYAMQVQMTSIVRTPADRERVLRSLSGLNPFPQRGVRHDPCDVREDVELAMLVGRPPEGVPYRNACGFLGGGAITNGRTYRPAHFMKLAPDGTPKFIVMCSVYVPAGDDGGPAPCKMQGYFGKWPLFISVLSTRASDWDATFDRVTEYLSRHTVSRTD